MGLFKNKVKAPWEKFYTKKELNIKVPDCSIYELIEQRAEEVPNNPALHYFGKNISYRTFMRQIDKCAKSFRSQGVREGDVVTICMPNTPEAIIAFYALNKIGAIANMIHPLSAEQEIKNYLNSTKSIMLIMIDVCYEKVKNIIDETNVYKTIVVSAKDSMPMLLGIGYSLTKGLNVKKPARSGEYIRWNDFMLLGYNYNGKYQTVGKKNTPAVILHSGGTTGNPKGIVLSNGNFNALALQVPVVMKNVKPKDGILAIMPIFHGFGLGVCVHVPLYLQAKVILIPTFDAKRFDKLITHYHPNVLVGVPTLWEAMLTNNHFKNMDLSMLKYVVSGGDSLTPALASKINIFLKEHHANIKVYQGYGMTESVAATALAWGDANITGSIGVPFPGDYYKIVVPNTQDEVPYEEEGEICVSGPTVMLGYLDNEKETNEVLQKHKDGRIWLHTGDMGYMTSDGIIFYTQRLKRMIISSGYNVYPSRIEQVIEEHEGVLKCTVVGIPHPYKVQVPKAYIVLKEGYSSSKVKKEIKELCEKNLAKFSVPKDFEFRKSLPKTLIGKVNYRDLERQGRENIHEEE